MHQVPFRHHTANTRRNKANAMQRLRSISFQEIEIKFKPRQISLKKREKVPCLYHSQDNVHRPRVFGHTTFMTHPGFHRSGFHLPCKQSQPLSGTFKIRSTPAAYGSHNCKQPSAPAARRSSPRHMPPQRILSKYQNTSPVIRGSHGRNSRI